MIGGGLLGLGSRARPAGAGLRCDSRPLDGFADGAAAGSDRRQVSEAQDREHLGVTVILGHCTTAIFGNGNVEGLLFKGGESMDADLVVIAAGIRPNAELGARAGLEVKRGIVVNDYMETSRPDIFAVGECVEHRGTCYGLVAPLFRAGQGAGGDDHRQRGTGLPGLGRSAAKLKIMGVDIFSAGISATKPEPASRWCATKIRRSGIYKKLTVEGRNACRLHPGRRYIATVSAIWIGCAAERTSRRTAAICCSRRPPQDAGLEVAQHAGQRDHLRLHGRDQRRRSFRRSTRRALTRWRS